MPIRGKTTKAKIKNEAKALMKKGYTRRDAFGVATRIVTGRGPKKKGRKKMPKHKRRRGRKGRKRYSEKHMDRGTSYANAPQGYRDDSGKPMGAYGKPPQGYIDQTGMPNAGRMQKALMHMSNYYGRSDASGSPYDTSSTNARTSPNVRAMDPTYRRGRGRGYR